MNHQQKGNYMEINVEASALLETESATHSTPSARAPGKTWFQCVAAGLLLTGVCSGAVVQNPLDLSFQDVNADNAVLALAIPASPSTYAAVLAGGAFTSINGGSGQSYLVLLNSSGHTAEFNGFPNGTVDSIVVQPDGKILIGGA